MQIASCSKTQILKGEIPYYILYRQEDEASGAFILKERQQSFYFEGNAGRAFILKETAAELLF